MYIVSHILTSAILILFVIAIRALAGHRMSQRLRYALWLVVAVKLLIPIPFSNVFNIAGTWTTETVSSQKEESTINLAKDQSKTADGQTFVNRPSESDSIYNLNDAHSTSDDINQGNTHTAQLGENRGSESAASEMSIRDDDKAVDRASSPIVEGNPMKSTRATENPSGFSWIIVLLIIWLAGVLLVAGVLIGSNLRFARKLRCTRVFHDTYEDKLNVYYSDEVRSPCLYGLFRPCVYLPTEEYTEENCSHILLHEWTHYKHGDHVWSLVRALCVSLYWFNPPVWIAAKLSVRDSELACDEGVLKKLDENEHRSYGHMLLDICEKTTGITHAFNPLLTTEMLGGSHEMKDRIKSISSYKKHSKLLIVVSILASVLVVGCTYGTGASANKNDKTDEMKVASAVSGTAVSGESVAAMSDRSDSVKLDKYIKAFAEYLIEHGDEYEHQLKRYEDYLGVTVTYADEPVLLVSEHTLTDKDIYGCDCSMGAELIGYSKEKEKAVLHTTIQSTGSGYPIMVMDGKIISGFHHWSDSYHIENGIVTDEKYEGYGYDKSTGTHIITQFCNMDKRVIKKEKLPIKEVESNDAYAEAAYRGSILPFFKIDWEIIKDEKIDEIVEILTRATEGGMEIVNQETVLAEKPVLAKVEYFIGEVARYVGSDETGSKIYKWKKGRSNGEDIYFMFFEILPDSMAGRPIEEIEKTYESFPGFEFRFSGDKLTSMKYVIGNGCLDGMMKEMEEVHMKTNSYIPPSTDVFSNMDMIVSFASAVAGKKSVLGANEINPHDIFSPKNNTVIQPSDATYEYIENRTRDTGNTYLAYEDTDGATYIWDATNQMMVSYSSGD